MLDRHVYCVCDSGTSNCRICNRDVALALLTLLLSGQYSRMHMQFVVVRCPASELMTRNKQIQSAPWEQAMARQPSFCTKTALLSCWEGKQFKDWVSRASVFCKDPPLDEYTCLCAGSLQQMLFCSERCSLSDIVIPWGWTLLWAWKTAPVLLAAGWPLLPH